MPRTIGKVTEMLESKAYWLAKFAFTVQSTGTTVDLSARLENYKDSENAEEIKMLLGNEMDSPSDLLYEIEFYEVEEKGWPNKYLARAKVVEDKPSEEDKPVDDKPVASWEQAVSNKDMVISRSVAYNQIMQSLARSVMVQSVSPKDENSPVVRFYSTWFEVMKAHEGELNSMVDKHLEIIRGTYDADKHEDPTKGEF